MGRFGRFGSKASKLPNKRTENAAIFFVRIFSKLGHLLIISSLAQKIFCLESLGFDSPGVGI